MPGRTGIVALRLALFVAVLGPAAIAAEPPSAPSEAPAGIAAEPPVAADNHAERSLLRMLHFEFGLVTACGLADDETRAGYEIATGRLERRLGIDHDAEARFRELNQGWTEANARWAAGNGAGFRDRCRTEAGIDRDRFKLEFRDTGQTLTGSPPTAGGLAALTLALALFVLAHLGLPVPAVRARLVGRLGEWGYLGLYSILSIVLLLWVVAAFAAAPAAQVWQPPTALRHLALTLVFVGVLLAVIGYTQKNPTAVLLDRFAGGGAWGITRVTRHPVLWGIGVWAVAHLLANGSPRALVLFSGLGFLAFVGAAEIDRRRRRTGGEAWRALAAETSNIPFAAMIAGRAGAGLKGTLAEIGPWRIGLGCLVYALLLLAHPWIAGLPAFRV